MCEDGQTRPARWALVLCGVTGARAGGGNYDLRVKENRQSLDHGALFLTLLFSHSVVSESL